MKQARIIVGANNTQEHNLKVSESLKKFYATPEGKIAQQNARKKNIGNMKMRMNINQKN